MEFVTECNLCGAKETKHLFAVGDYNIVECIFCGLAYTNPRSTAAEIKQLYEQEYFTRAEDYAASLQSKPITEDDKARVHQVIKFGGRSNGKILDVGCAAGGLLRAFKAVGWECYGIEPDAKMAAYTREKVGIKVCQGFLRQAPFPDNYFDAITACHVLEHDSDPNSFINRCGHLLKRGGVLLIEVPDFGSRSARKQKEKWRPLYPDTHLYHFTSHTLSRMLQNNGFKCGKIRRYGGMGILAPSESKTVNNVKQTAFNSRKILYQSKHLKNVIRAIYWNVLRMNEYIAVLSVKAY